MRSQRTFQTNACSLTGCSEPTTEDQILNAEILQALNMIDENYSFSSENGSKKCSRTRKLPQNILKKKQNPNMLVNLVSLPLFKMN